MKAATNPSSAIEHPPLAQDGQGNLLPVPNGTFAWRLSRHTGGRPRVVNGPDLAPLRLPLHVTLDDLMDICGPGTYRLYALDEVGAVIDYVADVEVGNRRRNAAPAEPEAPVFAVARGQSSDLRYALEALTHMARTYADSLRAVTEAQADWVKTIAMAKGLPRNVAMMPQPVHRHDDDDDDDDDGDDTDDGPGSAEPTSKSGIEAALTMVAPYIPEMMESWRGKKPGADTEQRAPVNPMAHLARIQAQLTPAEQQFLDVLLIGDDSETITTDLLARSVDDAVATIRNGVAGTRVKRGPSPAVRNAAPRLDPSTMQKLTAIAALLQPAERARLMKLGPKLMSSPDAIDLMNTLAPQAADVAAEWVRANLDEIEARFTS